MVHCVASTVDQMAIHTHTQIAFSLGSPRCVRGTSCNVPLSDSSYDLVNVARVDVFHPRCVTPNPRVSNNPGIINSRRRSTKNDPTVTWDHKNYGKSLDSKFFWTLSTYTSPAPSDR